VTEEDEAWLREQDAAEAQECFEKHRIHDVHDDESHISLPNWLRKQQQNIIKQHSSSILFNTTYTYTHSHATAHSILPASQAAASAERQWAVHFSCFGRLWEKEFATNDFH
jgi:hypothetical protein